MLTCNRERGFSLVELSIVLVVVGLLVGGLLGSAASFVNFVRARDVEKHMDMIYDAIIGFTLQNGRLPCADGNGDGIEDGPAACVQWGTLPYATLAVERRDAWGGDFLYRVDTNFADAPTGTSQSSFLLDDLGNITVYDSADLTNTVAVGIPVIVVSEGPNGGSGSDDENENIDDDNDFVQRGYSNAPGSEFNDKLMWISPLILKAKLLEVGKLP